MDELIPGDAYVRSDTPDPRAMSASAVPHLDITSAWPYSGTNNSGLKASSVNSPLTHSIPSEVNWMPYTTHTHSIFNCGAGYKHKRHWDNNDTRFYKDDPPCKVHVNEEKVAQQFRSMSLNPSKTVPPKTQQGIGKQAPSTGATENSVQCSMTMDAMWQRFHALENKLHGNTSDTEVDEGVDMGGDTESPDQSYTPVPTLHISPSLQLEIASGGLPQILVPRPCKEVVLWQPTGVDLIKETLKLQNGGEEGSSDAQISEKDSIRYKRKIIMATRTLSPNCSLLSVPNVRPNTPPPNSKAEPVSSDIPVHFVEEFHHSNMDLL